MLAIYVFVSAVFTIAVQDDDLSQSLWSKYRSAMVQGKLVMAEKMLTELIEVNEKNSTAFYLRGRLRFQLAKPKESVSDFDSHVKLSPRMESRQWERGISMYYAQQYKKGAEQFELYQTYHDNDVENSAWRFLCVAKSKSIDEARKNLLPIKNDTRVPMMQIYEMFQGKLSPEKVLEAARAESSSESEKNSALFYANLYVGLLKEVEGKREESLKYISEAKKHKIAHYMWDVANVHDLLRKKSSEKE